MGEMTSRALHNHRWWRNACILNFDTHLLVGKYIECGRVERSLDERIFSALLKASCFQHSNLAVPTRPNSCVTLSPAIIFAAAVTASLGPRVHFPVMDLKISSTPCP